LEDVASPGDFTAALNAGQSGTGGAGVGLGESRSSSLRTQDARVAKPQTDAVKPQTDAVIGDWEAASGMPNEFMEPAFGLTPRSSLSEESIRQSVHESVQQQQPIHEPVNDPDADLKNALEKYAKNLTSENVDSLVAELKARGVNSSGDLARLVDESKTRDMARSLYFGAVSSLGNVTNVGVTGMIASLAPDSIANRLSLGIFAAGPISTAVHTVNKSLGAQYHPLPSVAPKPYLPPTQLDSKTVIDDAPYASLGSADALAIGALAVSGTNGWRATVTQAAAGVAGFSARGYNTLRNAEAIRTSGGKNQIQPWLDAHDLDQTGKAIGDLQQPRPVALRGYAADIGSVLRDRLGPAIKALAYSPRPLAYVVALAPSGIADSLSRSAATPAAQVGWAVIGNVLHTQGLQQRLHIEEYMTRGVSSAASWLGLGEVNWTHKGALAKAGLEPAPARQAVSDPEQGPPHEGS
jgi:hypothetical protein